MFQEVQKYIIDQSYSIDGYLGAIMIGSEATGYATEDSDIDIHIFVDQTKEISSLGEHQINGRILSILIYPINIVLERIAKVGKIGSQACKRMYGIQGLILDDPYMIVSNIKDTANTTIVHTGYNTKEINFIIGGLKEYKRILDTLHLYAIDKLFFHIFEQYSCAIGFDHYNDFNISFRKSADRIFHDDTYASHHRGKIYPDKQFIELRTHTYNNRSVENISLLLEYTINKLSLLGE